MIIIIKYTFKNILYLINGYSLHCIINYHFIRNNFKIQKLLKKILIYILFSTISSNLIFSLFSLFIQYSKIFDTKSMQT